MLLTTLMTLMMLCPCGMLLCQPLTIMLHYEKKKKKKKERKEELPWQLQIASRKETNLKITNNRGTE